MSAIANFVGRPFGHLKVEEFIGTRRHPVHNKSSRYWRCACACGGSCEATTYQLLSGRKWHCDHCEPTDRASRRRTNNFTSRYQKELATFSEEELRELATILRGRKEPRIVAEAVDVILRERPNAA